MRSKCWSVCAMTIAYVVYAFKTPSSYNLILPTIIDAPQPLFPTIVPLLNP